LLSFASAAPPVSRHRRWPGPSDESRGRPLRVPQLHNHLQLRRPRQPHPGQPRGPNPHLRLQLAQSTQIRHQPREQHNHLHLRRCRLPHPRAGTEGRRHHPLHLVLHLRRSRHRQGTQARQQHLGIFGLQSSPATHRPAPRRNPGGVTETGGATNWSRTFSYDPYGNRAANGAEVFVDTPQFTATDFDDADNKQTAFCPATEADCTGVAPASKTTYDYDGGGNRVRKIVNDSQASLYVYDAFGNLASEYADFAPLAPRAPNTAPPTNLGSTRLVTDASAPTAQVLSRRDFFPFGEEIPASATYGNRHLVTDGTYNDPSGYRQQFTGQERDDESELDYFKARYHSASLGRFTSPDAPLLHQTAVSPQSWNLYQYVRNNPLLFIDPSGCKCIDVQVVEEDGTTTTGKADDGEGTGCKAAEVAETEDKKPPKEGETEDITPQKDQAEQAFLVPVYPIPSVLSPRKGRTESFLNDVTSIFGFDQNDERQSCFGDVFLGSVAKQARAVAAIGPAASFAGQAYYHNQALRHAATRGLTYPFKSSIFRGLLAKSTATVRIAGRAAPLAYLDVIMLLALNEELDAALNGRCQ